MKNTCRGWVFGAALCLVPGALAAQVARGAPTPLRWPSSIGAADGRQAEGKSQSVVPWNPRTAFTRQVQPKELAYRSDSVSTKPQCPMPVARSGPVVPMPTTLHLRPGLADSLRGWCANPLDVKPR